MHCRLVPYKRLPTWLDLSHKNERGITSQRKRVSKQEEALFSLVTIPRYDWRNSKKSHWWKRQRRQWLTKIKANWRPFTQCRALGSCFKVCSPAHMRSPWPIIPLDQWLTKPTCLSMQLAVRILWFLGQIRIRTVDNLLWTVARLLAVAMLSKFSLQKAATVIPQGYTRRRWSQKGCLYRGYKHYLQAIMLTVGQQLPNVFITYSYLQQILGGGSLVFMVPGTSQDIAGLQICTL